MAACRGPYAVAASALKSEHMMVRRSTVSNAEVLSSLVTCPPWHLSSPIQSQGPHMGPQAVPQPQAAPVGVMVRPGHQPALLIAAPCSHDQLSATGSQLHTFPSMGQPSGASTPPPSSASLSTARLKPTDPALCLAGSF